MLHTDAALLPSGPSSFRILPRRQKHAYLMATAHERLRHRQRSHPHGAARLHPKRADHDGVHVVHPTAGKRHGKPRPRRDPLETQSHVLATHRNVRCASHCSIDHQLLFAIPTNAIIPAPSFEATSSSGRSIPPIQPEEPDQPPSTGARKKKKWIQACPLGPWVLCVGGDRHFARHQGLELTSASVESRFSRPGLKWRSLRPPEKHSFQILRKKPLTSTARCDILSYGSAPKALLRPAAARIRFHP